MKNILLYDNITNGHHIKYNNEIFLKTKSDKWLLKDEFSGDKKIKGNRVSIEFKKYLIIRKMIKESNTIHFLYLDNMIFALFILSFSRIYKFENLSGTLHWAPKNKIKNFMFKFLLNKKKLSVVCHLDSIKNKYTNADNNIVVIKYPHFPFEVPKRKYTKDFDVMIKNEMLHELNSKSEKVKILMFGATSHYKGIDIVLESLSYINKEIALFIVGKEEFIKTKDLDQLEISNKKVALHYQLSFIDDTTADFLFKNIDYVLIPYKKYFSGQSGPIIDALAYKKRVIVSDIEVFKDYKIDEPDNIIFFEAENSHDLALKISSLDKKYYFEESNNSYSVTNFTNEYRKYFDEKIKK